MQLHDYTLEVLRTYAGTTHLIEELGDLVWYLALNVSLDEVMQANVDKLRTRYPHGFESERSRNR